MASSIPSSSSSSTSFLMKRKKESQSPGSSPSTSMIPKTDRAEMARFRRMRLDMKAWKPDYQAVTGLDEGSWQKIDAFIKQSEKEWRSLENGKSMHIPKEKSLLSRTVVAFKTVEGRFFPLVLLKTKEAIKTVGKGSEKTMKLVLDWFRGSFLVEYTLPTDNIEPTPSFLAKIYGKKGIMPPEIFRLTFSKEMRSSKIESPDVSDDENVEAAASKISDDESAEPATSKTAVISKTIVFSDLFSEDFQSLFFPSKNTDIKDSLQKLKKEIEEIDSKEVLKDDYTALKEDIIVRMTQHPLAVAAKIHRFLKRMSLQKPSPQIAEIHKILEQLAKLTEEEASRISISLAEKIVIIVDMLEALKTLNQEWIEHGDLIQGNILIEKDKDGKIIHAKLNDFECAQQNKGLFSKTQDPNAGTVGEILSRLYYKKFGANPLKLSADDVNSSDEEDNDTVYSIKNPPDDLVNLPERIIWELLHDQITTPEIMEKKIAQLEELHKQVSKDDEKKVDLLTQNT